MARKGIVVASQIITSCVGQESSQNDMGSIRHMAELLDVRVRMLRWFEIQVPDEYMHCQWRSRLIYLCVDHHQLQKSKLLLLLWRLRYGVVAGWYYCRWWRKFHSQWNSFVLIRRCRSAGDCCIFPSIKWWWGWYYCKPKLIFDVSIDLYQTGLPIWMILEAEGIVCCVSVVKSAVVLWIRASVLMFYSIIRPATATILSDHTDVML